MRAQYASKISIGYNHYIDDDSERYFGVGAQLTG